MKRILACTMILLLLLGGCKQSLPNESNVTDILSAGGGEEPTVWYALVRQVDETGFLANHQANPDCGLFECWPNKKTRWINASGLKDLQMGDVVAVTFDGCIDESYPGGIHRPESIKKADHSLETYLEQERLRLEKNAVHLYDFRVILKEYPLYDYSETPLPDQPDFSAVSPIAVKEEQNHNQGDPDKDYGTPFKRIFYITKQASSVDEALGVIRELMSLPEVLQAWAVPN